MRERVVYETELRRRREEVGGTGPLMDYLRADEVFRLEGEALRRALLAVADGKSRALGFRGQA